MNYLKAEHLKFKRTISNKLLFIAPFLTALFAWIIGGFYGFQYMTFYWWYAFLLPGTIAILCSLAHQKEERAGKYYSVLSAPINLKRFEYAKALLMIEKLLVAAVFLAVFAAVSNLISPALAVYSAGRNFCRKYCLDNCLNLANPSLPAFGPENRLVSPDCSQHSAGYSHAYPAWKYSSCMGMSLLLGCENGGVAYGN